MEQHYTKSEIENSDFLFVSYKHDDAEIVSAMISQLYDKGVRLWYDADLHIGDNWLKIAGELINNPNCKGVIFFNSIASFKSQPVHNERMLTLSRIKADKERGRTFHIFPINISCGSNVFLLKKVFDSLPDEPISLAREFPFDFVKVITELFTDDTIYAAPDDLEACAQKLFASIKTKIPNAIDTDYLHMKKLEQNFEQTRVNFELGVCKGEPVSTLPIYELQRDQVLTVKNEPYIIWNKQGYRAKPIVWIPLYCENDVFAMLSQDIVDIRGGGPDLQNWLNGPFKEISFHAEERAAIRGIRLMSQADMEKALSRESFPLPTSHWWISDINTGALQRVIRKDGTVYTNGYHFRNTKSGVRPVLLIGKDDLAKLTNK